MDANGVTRYGLPQSAIKNALVPVPPLLEQRAIVRFLEDRLAEIDQLIEGKRRLIKLLQEKNDVTICRAVTRGVHTRVETQATGLRWLGDIPESWKLHRNGALFLQRDERGFPGLPTLTVSIHTGVTVDDPASGRRKQMPTERSTYKRAVKRDIAYNKMRLWQGAVGVVPEDGLVSTDYTVAKPLPGVNPDYFAYLFRTTAYKTEINRYSHGIVPDRNRLYWDEFKQMTSPVPPFAEQTEIVNYIGKETGQTSMTIARAEREIELINEYRTALISNVVTGKIDVRSLFHDQTVSSVSVPE